MSRSVVFVHGLWLHSDSWGSWAELFRSRGYEPHVPGWPGDAPTVDAARKAPEDVAGYGIDDVVAQYTTAIQALDSKPVVVGHSFGGLIAQRLLTEGTASAAVAVDAAPIRGVLFLPPSALRVASVALRNPANRKKAVSLSEEQFRYGFGNAIPAQESSELYDRWTVPSPGRPLFEAAAATFNRSSPAKIDTRRSDRGPLLLIGGGQDHTVPAMVTRATHKLYARSGAKTDIHEFPDRGHSLCIDSRWREVAE